MIAALRGEHTILLSTHILSEIERTCDRILMMHKGRVAAQGSEEQLAAQLRRGRALELEVRGQEGALRAALAGIASDGALSVAPTEQGTLRAVLRVDDALREKVSAAVVHAGLGLLGLSTATTDLEAIFLELSGAGASPPTSSGTGSRASTPGGRS